MNLIHLEYFRAVANAGSMTKAAEKLHVTQPTLSNSIKALEQELGVQLFERRGRSLALNSTGVEFLKSVNSIFGLLRSKKQKKKKNFHNPLKSCTFAPHFNGNHREEGPKDA